MSYRFYQFNNPKEQRLIHDTKQNRNELMNKYIDDKEVYSH